MTIHSPPRQATGMLVDFSAGTTLLRFWRMYRQKVKSETWNSAQVRSKLPSPRLFFLLQFLGRSTPSSLQSAHDTITVSPSPRSGPKISSKLQNDGSKTRVFLEISGMPGQLLPIPMFFSLEVFRGIFSYGVKQSDLVFFGSEDGW